MKRVLSLILAIVMLFSMASVAMATGPNNDNNAYIYINANGMYIDNNLQANDIYTNTSYGTVKYTSNTNTLILDGFNYSGKIGIRSDNVPLIIELKEGATNTISSSNYPSIYSTGNLTIKGSGTFNVTASGYECNAISVSIGNLIIDGATITTVATGADSSAIYVPGYVSGGSATIKNGAVVNATSNGSNGCGICASQTISFINSTIIVNANDSAIRTYNFEPTYTGCTITSPTDAVWSATNYAYYVGSNPVTYLKIEPTSGSGATEEEVSADDPDTDVEIGGKTVNVKYGNNTIVVDDKILEDIDKVDSKNVKIDFSKTGLDVDKVILQNDVVKEINAAGKGVEFITKYAYAELEELDPVTDNSIVIGLGEGLATYQQVKAMETTNVVAEVKYDCTSNAKCLDTDAKIYVPCDYKDVRVFYLIDEHTIGTLPCEVVDGYCVFDRYQDGTYVVVK